MTAYIIDTETTGGEPLEVIELAYEHWEDCENRFVGRFRPTQPMSWGALAVHHILLSELTNCPPSSEAKLPDDAQYIIGHNIDYDWKALGCPKVKCICTLAIARALHPSVDSHSLTAMTYFLFGATEETRADITGAHTAEYDVKACGKILTHMLSKLEKRIDTIEQLWAFSEQCRIPKYMTFGKYKGVEIAKLDRGYAAWCLKQPDMDPYVRQAILTAGRV